MWVTMLKSSLKGKNSKIIRGALNKTQFREQSESLFLTSGFTYQTAEQAEAIFKGDETGFQYTRYANPTIDTFEKRMAVIDGSESCFATASGMAAVFASLMCQLKAGDHVVSATALFGSCREVIKNIITRYGIEVSFVDGKNIDNWEKEIKSNTKTFFFETPSNPCLEIVDIEAVCKLAKKNNVKVVVDNILASPVLQNPSKFGADIIVYSGTKHIDGQGRTMGGAILSSEKFREDTLKPFLRHTGPCISPFNAWVLSKGLETVGLRVIEQSKTAEKVVEFLSKHNEIELVNYPFKKNHPQYDLAKKQQKMGGNVLSFYIKGKKKEAFKFLNNLKMIDICNNLGDTKSLAIHPATTTHRVLTDEERNNQNIHENLVRLSVGLEDFEDIKNDLDQALIAI
jgi:O-succinylhomoserine sulfhydrylase